MKKFIMSLLALCMLVSLTIPAHALEYTFDEDE